MSFMPIQTNESKVQYVMAALGCSRPEAIRILQDCNWDCMDAVIGYRAYYNRKD